MSSTTPETHDDTTGGSTTRRNFLKLAGAVSAGTIMSEHLGEVKAAFQQATEGSVDVVWLQGQACSGCTTSMLQGQYPALEDVLSEFRLDVTFHPTIMAETGEAAIESMSKDPDILVMEGAVPYEMPHAATVGHTDDGHSKPVLDWVEELAPKADYVVSVGNCASFGGWPAADHKPGLYGLGDNVTGARGLQFEGREKRGVLGPDFTSGAGLPVVNLGGCPPNPDYILLTLATILNGHTPELDEYNRPLPFYEPLVHDNCPRRGYFDRGEFADKPGEEGCLYEVGCAGPYTRCDDMERLWNDGTSVCLNVGAPCMGCMEPAFWDRFTPFYDEVEQQSLLGGIDAPTAGGAALLAAGAGIGAHIARKAIGYGDFSQANNADQED